MTAPRLLNQKTAAAYCGMSVAIFVRECKATRRRVHPGLRGLRYDVRDLDKWINGLADETGSSVDWSDPVRPRVTLTTEFLARLDGHPIPTRR